MKQHLIKLAIPAILAACVEGEFPEPQKRQAPVVLDACQADAVILATETNWSREIDGRISGTLPAGTPVYFCGDVQLGRQSVTFAREGRSSNCPDREPQDQCQTGFILSRTSVMIAG